ncbi:hypothetical protein COM65_28595 [Bacillus wiedmannii]|uniref:hypothetical protein n=1 Tax=Bacillus wiedmannii TaxID=1890302 RepID=UPI000BF96B24|nr:hypothetical protein [Bacillus wiedmannii]PGE55219.1 hypothetical protein COM65_28595 [Bacillus wiedmannii]HDR7914774.1 hypothetical protein [Bacillus wiedmannii]
MSERVFNIKVKLIVLYKKVGEEEKAIAVFGSLAEAIKYSKENNIMGTGWIRKSLEENTYPYFRQSARAYYPHATEYRFEYQYKELPVIL